MVEGTTLSGSVLSEGDWEQLIVAAETAGRQSAREMARRCTRWELGRTGQVWVRVQPADSPVVHWLHCTGRSEPEPSGALMPVMLSPQELSSAGSPERKARSLLVRRAYAEAYCTVLVQEAGVVTELVTLPDQHPRGEPHTDVETVHR